MTPKRRLPHRLWAALFFAAALAGLAALGFSTNLSHADEDDEQDTVQIPSRVTVKDGIVTITLDASAQQEGGIVTAGLQPATTSEPLIAYGAVLDAAELADMHNRLIAAKTSADAAQAKLAASQTALTRARRLYQDRQNVSASQLEDAKAVFGQDQATLAAAKSNVAAMTVTAAQTWGPVLGKALIVDAPIVERLIDRRTYLIRATLAPGIPVPAPPVRAEATLSSGATTALTLVSRATTTDPAIQGTSYFYEAAAQDELLPGLHLTVSLPGSKVPRGFVVPESAVVWLQGKPWVYLRTSKTTFIRQGIAPRAAAATGGYIVPDLVPDLARGLAARPQLVVVGAQMLLSEEFRGQTATGGDQD